MDNIILIGFMGSGKTSIGVQLAKRLGYTFQDTDLLIEKKCNKTIRNIFSEEGENYFRRLETQVITDLCGELNHTVLSVGGGLPITEGNSEILRRLGQVIFLKVSKETIKKRLKGDTTRPLLAGQDAEKKVEELLQYREPIYEATAHYTVVTDDKSFECIMDEIIKLREDGNNEATCN